MKQVIITFRVPTTFGDTSTMYVFSLNTPTKNKIRKTINDLNSCALAQFTQVLDRGWL